MSNQLQQIIRRRLRYSTEIVSPSEYSERNRVMTSDVSSAFPGRFTYDRNPYLRELVNHLSPRSNAKRVVIMKGAQIGVSTGVIENGIVYKISEYPGNILVTVGHENLIPEMSRRIDQAIDSCGLRGNIHQNTLRKSRATGDTVTAKQFAGGGLQLWSATNSKKIMQISVGLLLVDDFDAIPKATKSDGDIMDLLEQRGAANSNRFKSMYISTPRTKMGSNVEPAFLKGDQRYFFVPCPCCGVFIVWEWEVFDEYDQKIGGITWELDSNNKLIVSSVGYTCQECGGFFNDRRKQLLMNQGQWIATAESSEEYYYSYHISALYAAVGMDDWAKYVKQYLRANPPDGEKDEGREQTFYNLVLGKTYQASGKQPKSNKMQANMGGYEIGVVPTQLSQDRGHGKIVMLTCACDLNGFVDDARLDYEIVAWSEDGSSFSVDHGSIGTFVSMENRIANKTIRKKWNYIHNHPMNVWDEFDKVLKARYPRDDGERTMGITISGIDTGHYTSHAYSYMDRRGIGLIVGAKGHVHEKSTDTNMSRRIYKQSTERDRLYILHVNDIKDVVYAKMNLEVLPGIDPPPGIMYFPNPSGYKYSIKRYFNHFESEQKIEEVDQLGAHKSFVWRKKHSGVQNHLWDCRVYNVFLKTHYADVMCRRKKLEPSWENYVGLVKEMF